MVLVPNAAITSIQFSTLESRTVSQQHSALVTSNMELLYPGYKAYFDRFDTKSFQTEYTTRYCNSEEHVLYSQIPKHPWSEPRRPAAASRYISYGAAARPTHLRPPFAARVLSYVPNAEGKYIEQNSSRAENENSRRLMYSSDKTESFRETYLTDLRTKRSGDLTTVLTTQSSENASPKKNLTDGQVLQKLGVSSPHALCNAKKVQLKNHSSLSQLKQNQINHMLDPQSPLPAHITLSVSNKQPRTFTKRFVRPALARDLETMASHFTSKNGKQVQERVAPRPSTLLSKHSKNVRYVRDTCFFHPTEDRKKHYYIVNPNWISEQRVKIPKNNVFS